MGDPLDGQLRGSARVFTSGTPGGGTGGIPTGGGLAEVRTRSARRRRRRRAATSTAAVVVALLAGAGALRGTGGRSSDVRLEDDPSARYAASPTTAMADVEGTTDGSTATAGSLPPPATAEVPSTSTVPAPTIPPPGQSPAGPPSPTVPTTTAPRPAPLTGPVTVSADGLGVVAFGQDYGAALGALTGQLGAPDDAGTVTDLSRACGATHNRDVRWGELTVSFIDTGSGLRLSGYYWGNDIRNRNTNSAHAAPVGPGSPTLGNPWGLHLATAVPSADDLASQVGRDYPDARFQQLAGFADPTVSAGLPGGRYLHIVLHPAPGGGHLVESIWALTPGDVVCL
jgi:hypothetical protein